jgi:hypothetical protein
MAVVQLRNQTAVRAYFDRKVAAGKNPMEAVGALERRLSDIVYHQVAGAVTVAETGPGGHSGTTADRGGKPPANHCAGAASRTGAELTELALAPKQAFYVRGPAWKHLGLTTPRRKVRDGMELRMIARSIDAQAVTTAAVGGIEYGAIRQRGSAALRVAWRYRISHADRWFACGELVPDGKTFTVQGWDGQLIGRVTRVRDGLEAVRHFYASKALAAPGQRPAPADSQLQ